MERTTGAVYFHDDGSSSCLLTTKASSKEAFMHELCFWGSFANRQFTNMGRDGTILADRLLRTASVLPSPDETGNEADLPEWLAQMAEANREVLLQQPSDEPRLRDQCPGSANKRFEAVLAPDGEGYKFFLDMKGFGWLGRGLDRYCPWSVTLLLRHLIRKYESEPKKMASLVGFAMFTGQSYALGQVNMQNANLRASMAVGPILEAYGLLPEQEA